MIRYLVILLAIGCQAGTAGDWLQKFSGDFGGNSRFEMTLAIEGNKATGVYFYHKYMKDIMLSGQIENHGSVLALHEHDANGNVVAKFEFPLKPPVAHQNDEAWAPDVPDFGPDAIEGRWTRVGSDRGRKVTLSHSGSCGGELGNLYGMRKDEKTHAQMRIFWDALKTNNRAVVASCISFPIHVSVNGKRRGVNGPKELFAIYPQVFKKDFVTAVSDCPPRNLWNNYQGLMLGQGLVWFDKAGMVIAINN